ncbi:PAS domain S-box protein, partial [candidate division KSB1 bacterium]|nr:PAS domain S-box protein [candidate division KSB1 bacterium]
MKKNESKIKQLETKLAEAEEIISTIERGEADAVLSQKNVMLLRLKETEKALQEIEQRYHSFVEKNPDAVFYLDVDGIIREVNLAAQELTGYSKEELIGMNWLELCEHEDKKRVMRHIEKSLAGKTIEWQALMINKDNQRSYLFLTAGTLIDSGAKKGLFIVAQDYTKLRRIEDDLRVHQEELETQNEELRRTQEELERTRNSYLDLFEHAPVGYLLLNADGTIRDANLTAAKLFGRERSNLAGLRIGKLAISDDHDKSYLHLRNLSASNGKQSMELRFHGPEKSIFWALVETVAFGQDQNNVDAFRMTITDVTKKKLAEQALKEAERKYRELVQFAPAGIYEIDFRKRKFTAVNDVMCEMLGYSREELLAMDPFSILDTEGQARFRERMKSWLAGVKQVKNVEYRVKTKDGRILDILLEVTFTADDKGKPLGATVVAHDITERKRTERALERERELLQQIVENIPVMLVTWEPSLKRFTLNRCATDVLGWTNEDANNGDLMRKVYPDPEYRAEVGTYMQSFSPEWREFDATARNGEKIPSLWNNIRLNDDTMIGIGIDVRELKEAEEKMVRQNTVLEGIARILSETITTETEEELGSVCLKVAEGITNSQISFLAELNHRSGKLEEITISSSGWDECRMSDKSGHGKKSPPVFDIQGIFGRVLRDGSGYYTNDPSSHPDSIGTPEGHPKLSSFLGVPLFQEKRIIGMMGLGNCENGYRPEDLEAAQSLSSAIVEALFRKRAEQALIESEKKNRALVRYAPAGIFEVDFHKQCFTVFNDAMCRMVGYSREELLEMSPFDILHKSEHAHFEKQIKKWLNEKEPNRTLEYKIKSADGRILEMLLQATYTRDEDGKPLG